MSARARPGPGKRTKPPLQTVGALAARLRQRIESKKLLTASQKKTGSANGKTEPVNREKFNLKQAFAA